MADQKVTALTAETAPVAADLMLLVDDVAGTPTSKKATVGNLAASAPFSGLYLQTATLPPDPKIASDYEGAYGAPLGSYDESFSGSSSSLPSGWSWQNQGGATFARRLGAGILQLPASGGVQMRQILRALPSESTWEATILASGPASGVTGDTVQCGLVLRNSGTAANAFIRRASQSGAITTRSGSDAQGSAANYSAAYTTHAAEFGLRVRRNSATSWDFKFSPDGGISWVNIDMARDISGHVTPDQIGFFALNNIAFAMEFAIHEFRVTA